MNPTVPGQDTTADPRAAFAVRPPSQGWERIAAPDAPQNAAWVWFKPPATPTGLILRIPDEAYQTNAPAIPWTMRRLLLAASVEPAAVITWHVHGGAFPAAGGTNPLLDMPVPPPRPGTDPNIVVMVAVHGYVPHPVMPMMPGVPVVPHMPLAPHMMAPGPVVAPAGNQRSAALPPAPAHLLEAYEHIENDWRSCQDTEKDLARLRQQLLDMMGRLKALNRELSGPERVHSNSQEKKDWLNARRMLRDCSNRLWKCVKAHDIGYTSAAGQRRWFEETYEKYIAPRKHFDGFVEADRAFGTYRKTVTTLHIEMTNSLSIAQLDGERRAQQVLARIAEKVREAGNRKNFLGVMLD